MAQVLFDLHMQVLRRKQLMAQLASLVEQENELRVKESQLEMQMQEEQRDVDKLEGRSLARLFHAVTGNYEEKLDKEKQEALAAVVRYEAAQQELAAVVAQIAEIEAELATLTDCEQQYQALVEQRLAEEKVAGPHREAILEVEEKIAYLEQQKREVNEAIQAGEEAEHSVQAILTELDDAHSMGVWDILGGGLLVDLAKHDHLDRAQRLTEELQVKLRRFKTELTDVEIDTQLQVQLDGFLTFADYFFDGFFADAAVLGHIEDSQSKLRTTREQIEQVLMQLQDLLDKAEKAQEQLNLRRNQFAVEL